MQSTEGRGLARIEPRFGDDVDADLLNQPERLLDMLFDLNEKAATDPNYRPFGVRESSLLEDM